MVIASAFPDHAAGRCRGRRHARRLARSDAPQARRPGDRRTAASTYVVQEAVTLSTMPVWRERRLEPRPFSLRLFLAKVGEGWHVMPGGFVRIADDIDARAVSLQRGGRTADAWVLSDGPVAETTLLPSARAHRHQAGERRAAEPRRRQSVLGRPLRRARRGDVAAGARADQPHHRGGRDRRAAGRADHRRCSAPGAPARSTFRTPRPALIARAALSRGDFDGSLPHLVGAARAAASVIRDRFSPDAWRALERLAATIDAPLPDGPAGKRDVRARRRGACASSRRSPASRRRT